MNLFIMLFQVCILLLASCTCANSISNGNHDDSASDELNLQDYPDSLIQWDGHICGNGIPEAGEECDDGNIFDCDGCSRNCEIEAGECGLDAGSEEAEADDASDAGQDNYDTASPSPPEPLGDFVQIESADGDEDAQGLGGGRLRVIWTGSYFSIIRHSSCITPGLVTCLSMMRFDVNGVVLGPNWLYEPVEEGFSTYDYCWNGDGFGLLWSDGLSVYFLRLNADGKPRQLHHCK